MYYCQIRVSPKSMKINLYFIAELWRFVDVADFNAGLQLM